MWSSVRTQKIAGRFASIPALRIPDAADLQTKSKWAVSPRMTLPIGAAQALEDESDGEGDKRRIPAPWESEQLRVRKKIKRNAEDADRQRLRRDLQGVLK